ncbi:MAG: radical SAM family heme chaperone HemW [Phenylobacterium sp.]|uniref:radical SAM family heme chaperone HemW n=1 Tax=Phenylobacterium sp. TaxID=1871053 RepID=UPI003918E717
MTPLGVYIHWPYCSRICPYCDFNVLRDRGRRAEQTRLAEAIVADLRAQAARIGPRALVSVFFGGGTPSLMEPQWVAEILATARALWTPDGEVEASLEANPTDAEAGRFADFAAAGINRLSLGIQSLDDAALALLGRNHDAAAARRAAEIALAAFPRLSIDLIYARPGQTVAAWRAELAAALELQPEHVSPYQLTIEAGTAFERAARRGTLVPPDSDVGADLYEATGDILGEAGFTAYEISNHARGEAARSRHNLVYWRGWDYIGAGPGAHGRLTLEGVRRATVAARAPADYIACVEQGGTGVVAEEALTPREAAEERLLMGLRVEEGVGFDELAPLGLHVRAHKVAELRAMGLLEADVGRLRATSAGRLVLDRLIAELSA